MQLISIDEMLLLLNFLICVINNVVAEHCAPTGCLFKIEYCRSSVERSLKWRCPKMSNKINIYEFIHSGKFYSIAPPSGLTEIPLI